MFSSDSQGVSSVIAVALLVAIVVALTGLVSVSIFFLQDDSGDQSAEASVDMTATQTGVEVTLVRNENAEEFVVQSPSGSTNVIEEIGDTTTLNDGVGVYSVVAKLPDGAEQVLDTRRISESDISGLFTVDQDINSKEADAIVKKDYAGTDQYEVTVQTSDSAQSGSLTAFTPDSDTGRLLSNPAEREGMILQSEEGIGIGAKVDLGVPELLQVAPVSPQPTENQFSVGEEVQLDKMVNLCEGDRVYLVDKKTEEVIGGGDEIQFDTESCDKLRRVAQYKGGEIVGVELINLWNQAIDDYSVFEFNGDVPPPTRPTPEGDSLDVNIDVKNKDTGDPISSASVKVGDLEAKNTNSNGEVSFTMGQEDITLFATANADGFFSSQVSVDLIGDANSGVIEKTIELPPENEQTFQPVTEQSSIPQIPTGDSTVIDTSGSSGIAVSGGSGGGFSGGGGGGGTVSGSGSIYSGSSISSTSTFSSATEPEPVTRDSPDPLVDITQPDRQFNTLSVDQDIIPTGVDGEFLVRTSVRAFEDAASEIEDEVIIKAIGSDGSEVNLEGVNGDTQEQTVFLTPGETQVVEQKLYFPEGTPAGDYSILVSLGSVTEVQSAGNLEVFQGSLTETTISGADVSPQEPTIEKGGSEEITVTVKDEDVSANSGSLKIDLFENGRRVSTKEFNLDNQAEIQFTETVNELEYYEYHVGIQESQSVALADSVLVSPVLKNTDINLDSTLSIKPQNNADCDAETDVGGQFDCEILKGESVKLDGSITAEGNDVSELEDVEIIWTWKEASENGQERAYFEKGREQNGETVIDWEENLGSKYSISELNSASSDKGQFDNLKSNSVEISKQETITYDRSEAYILELRIRGQDADGNQIGAQADKTLNVAVDPSKTATQITNTATTNEDTGRLVIESNRGSTKTDVELEFVDESGNEQRSKEVTVPRRGGQLELLESFTLSNYQDPNAAVGDNVEVGVRIKELNDDGSIKGKADEATLTFQVVPEIVVNANIRPIACESSGDADSILTTLDSISNFDQFSEFNDKQDAQDVFATSLDKINIIDPTYWDSSNNQLNVSKIESNTSCVVAGA